MTWVPILLPLLRLNKAGRKIPVRLDDNAGWIIRQRVDFRLLGIRSGVLFSLRDWVEEQMYKNRWRTKKHKIYPVGIVFSRIDGAPGFEGVFRRIGPPLPETINEALRGYVLLFTGSSHK